MLLSCGYAPVGIDQRGPVALLPLTTLTMIMLGAVWKAAPSGALLTCGILDP